MPQRTGPPTVPLRPLNEIGWSDAPLYGPKAAMLGELARAGFTVPLGLAVPASCFDAFLRSNGFRFRPEEYAAQTAEMASAIEGYAFDPAFVSELFARAQDIRRAHPTDRLIVRTSALCEDRRATSLAGVFRSFPQLETDQEVLEAVRGCYLSVFADGVINRFAEGLIEPTALKAGVIVQRCVAGELSGVTFTADPTTTDPGRVRITVAAGPCSGVTDGSARTTTYTADRQSGAVHAVAGEPPPEAQDLLPRLLESARAVEALAGECQDVEWTVAQGVLYLLQSRPVTGFREAAESVTWRVPQDPDGTRTWSLRRDRCLPPLAAEIAAACTSASGDGAYRYGMDWDSVEACVVNGYLYEARREIPGGKERLDAYFRVLNDQFDRGTGEFAEHIRPELEGMIADLERRYLHSEIPFDRLAAYLHDAEHYMTRSVTLHWRATTSEWYLGHFFRQRVERLLTPVSAQDLVDLAYGTTTMIAEREMLYELAEAVRQSAALTQLFATFRHDRIAAARLERSADAACRRLLARLREYAGRYGWVYGADLEAGEIRRGGCVPLPECVARVRRYLHVDLVDYRSNLEAVRANAARLKATARARFSSPEDADRFEAAVRAGEQAFLAGDDHSYLICSRRYAYIADALARIGEALAERGLIDAADDVRYLTLDEVRAGLAEPHPLHGTVRSRRAEHAAWCRVQPPGVLGRVPEPPGAGPETPAAEDSQEADAVAARGESGTRRSARGRVHVGFPSDAAGEGLVLLLEHGHEGDLTTVLRQVNGLVFKGGTPACHMGIIARELGIPAIYGVGAAAASLRPGDEVEIRGETGEVVRLPDRPAAGPPGHL